MNLQKLIFVNNDCFRANRFINVKGIMVHSTGANNPWLRRYVGPDDGLLGHNSNNNHWNQPRPGGRQVCVHGFIGKLADGSIATYQTLPWDMRGWHAGSGPRGTANDTHVSFEICEDDLTNASYFNSVYKEATELCAYLCQMFNLDPLADGVLIGHFEGHARGLASNHADPRHWFSRFGKSMDTFRADVQRLIGTVEPEVPGGPQEWHHVRVGAYSVKANAEAALAQIRQAGFMNSIIMTETNPAAERILDKPRRDMGDPYRGLEIELRFQPEDEQIDLVEVITTKAEMNRRTERSGSTISTIKNELSGSTASTERNRRYGSTISAGRNRRYGSTISAGRNRRYGRTDYSRRRRYGRTVNSMRNRRNGNG